MPRVPRRGWTLWAVTAFVVATIVAPAAWATFTSGSSASGSVSTLLLGAPSGLGATVSGHDVALSWTAGSNGTGYAVMGVANAASSDCSAVTFSSVGSASGTSYTDTGRFSPQGSYFCYQALTTRGASWTSASGNPTLAVRLGFFAATVALANGGTAGRLDTGDTVVVTFDQAVTTSSGPSGTNSVCATNAGVIVLGATATTGTCSSGETRNLASLTGGTTAANGRWNATWTWSNGNKTLTVVLGTRTSGAGTVTTSGPWTFNPVTTATKLLSSTGSFHVCDTNTGGGLCLPAATGSL